MTAQRKRPHRVSSKPVIEELETRILYAADLAIGGLEGAALTSSAQIRSLESDAEAPASTASAQAQQVQSHEIVFVDASIKDYQQLVQDAKAQNCDMRQIEVVVLTPDQSGIEQISRTLAQYQDLSAVHILSHGANASVQLGNSTLNFDSLLKNAASIKHWGNALSENGDILLYGCDVAEHADGKALVDALARLTGADVAASDDKTGQSLKGGDWNLEYAAGRIETSVALSQAEQNEWDGLLTITANGSTSSAVTPTSGAGSLTWSHTVASGSDIALFVGLSIENGGTSTGVTYGGTAMTLVGRSTSAGLDTVEIWTLLAPTVGTANVVATFNVSSNQAVGGGAAFNGVNQTTPTGTFAAASGTSTAPSVTVSSAAGELVIDTLFGNDGPTATLGGGQTVDWNAATGSGSSRVRGGSSTEAGAASVTMSWTLSSSVQWRIGGVSIKAAPDAAPVVTTTGTTLSYTENAAATAVDAGLTVTDADSVNLSSATVTISNGFQSAEDTLAFTSQNGISGSWNAGTGVLTLSGSATVANYQTALRSVTYVNSSDSPNTTMRTVSFVVNDGSTNSNTATRNISITAVNDAPTLTDRALSFDGTDLVVVAPDASLVMTSAVTIEAMVQRTGALGGTQIIVNKEGEYEIAISVNGKLQWAFANTTPGWNWVETSYTVPADTWVQVAVTYNSGVVKTYANGTLVDTYNGTGTIGDVYPALNDLTIGGRQNTTAQRFTGLIDEVRVWNVERSGAQIQAAYNASLVGNEAGLVGYWRFGESSSTTAIDSSPLANNGVLGNGNVGDEPTRTANLDYTSTEDSALVVVAPGVLTLATDPEGSPLTAVLVSGPTNAAAFTLNANGSFSYNPTGNFNGVDSFVFRVSDGSLNSPSATVYLTVTPVNDAPTASGSATLAAINEDTANPPGATVSSLFSGNYSDATDQVAGGSSANTFAGIAISAYTVDAAKGNWQYSTNTGGSWTTLGNATTIAAVMLDAAASTMLRFVPAANYNGAATALAANLIESGLAITNGATINLTGATGTTTPISSATVTLGETVNPVAHTPSVTNATTNEDTQSTTALVITLNAADGAEVTHFQITGITSGTLYQNNGTTVINDGDFITYAQGNAGLKFTPTANFNGSASFTVQASTSNGVGGLGGGTVNATITVNAVNDEPVFTALNGTLAFTEGGLAVVLDSDVTIADAELTAANTFNGATLTLARNGGANANDVYSNTGTLGPLTQGGSLVVGATTIGTVTTNSSGTLVLTFNTYATNALVNSAMQQIAYSNSSDTPPASVQINWSFNDNNAGAQGTGGALSASGSTTVTITATNDSPVGVPLITGTVTEDQTLTANTAGISDPDGLGAFSYQWLRNGASIFGATSNTYALSDADVGTNISVRVAYTDGQGTPETLTSAQTAAVANVNDAPTGSVTIDDTTPTQGQTLTASNTLADADGLGAITYTWKADGSTVGTGTTYVVTEAEVGKLITVVASYTDGHGTNESVSSATTAAVANVNDAPTGAVSINNTTPNEGDVLSASNTLTDADGLSGAISYQWQRNGVNISGATGTSYTNVRADVGSVISVLASYTDDKGTAESVSSAATAVVANLNNAPTGSVSISGTPTEDQTLSASNTLADADGMGVVSYQWYRNGVAIGGASGSTYTLGDADVGSTITVVGSYTDGGGTNESVSSAGVGPIANVNVAPVGVPTITGTAMENQTLTANTSGISDADGLGAFSYQWLRNGVVVGGATANTYTLGNADVGTQISVQVAYSDAHGTAEGPLTSAPTAAVSVGAPAPSTGSPATLIGIDPLAGTGSGATGAGSSTDAGAAKAATALAARVPPRPAPTSALGVVSETGLASTQFSARPLDPVMLEPLNNPLEISHLAAAKSLVAVKYELAATTPSEEWSVSKFLWDDLLRGKLASLGESDRSEEIVIVNTSLPGKPEEPLKFLASPTTWGVVAGAGAAWWAGRAGLLLGSVLAAVPAWARLDPLPIAYQPSDEERLEPAEDAPEDKEAKDEAENTGVLTAKATKQGFPVGSRSRPSAP